MSITCMCDHSYQFNHEIYMTNQVTEDYWKVTPS